MKTSKIVGLASAFTMLASLAAMPASATCTNAYSISYETLTRVIETDSNATIPAGAVAVTMSVKNNTGFDSNTLALKLDEDYQFLTDTEGNPIVTLGNVLNGFDSASSVSVNNNKVCIAVASASESTTDGELFTVYCVSSSTDKKVQSKAEIASIVPPCTKEPLRTIPDGWYMVGDVDNSEVVNSIDAARILTALSNANVSYIYVNASYKQNVSNYFNNPVPYYKAPDAIDDYCIDDLDATAILSYAANIGAGNPYNGAIGGLRHKDQGD